MQHTVLWESPGVDMILKIERLFGSVSLFLMNILIKAGQRTPHPYKLQLRIRHPRAAGTTNESEARLGDKKANTALGVLLTGQILR